LKPQCEPSLRCWKLLAILFGWMGVCLPAIAAELPVDAESLRGVWLERFTQFVQWPVGHRVTQADVPFELCVVDDAKFTTLLSVLYAQQTIKGKSVRVHSLEADSALGHCDLLFLSALPPLSRDAVLNRAGSHAVLVVSASPGYGAAGSHINLYDEGGYLRFEINLDAVQSAGLVVSSRLLAIARVLRNTDSRDDELRKKGTN